LSALAGELPSERALVAGGMLGIVFGLLGAKFRIPRFIGIPLSLGLLVLAICWLPIFRSLHPGPHEGLEGYAIGLIGLMQIGAMLLMSIAVLAVTRWKKTAMRKTVRPTCVDRTPAGESRAEQRTPAQTKRRRR